MYQDYNSFGCGADSATTAKKGASITEAAKMALGDNFILVWVNPVDRFDNVFDRAKSGLCHKLKSEG